jgi:YD repeat-containing protein
LTLTWNSLNPSGCPNALLCVSGPDGVTWKYVGDGNGRLFKVNDGTRDLYAVSYDTSNRITKVQNANDLDPAHASPGYNGNHAVTITYTGDGKVATVNDGPITNQTPATSTWSFAYHPGSVSTTATRADHIGMPAGTVRTAAGYTTVTPPNQQGQQSPKSVKTYYDDQNRPIEVDDILGHVREWAYNNHNEVQWLEDADGNPVDNVWDTVNNVLLSTTGPDPDGAGPLSRPTITYRYDETQIGTASTASAALTGFRGDYYANINLSGRPAATETDSNVDFYWGTGAPSALPGVTSNYSVRWSGEIKIGNVGDYTFNTSADDGTRLTIDGISAIDNWKDQSITQVTSQPIHLDNGLHKFVLEYYHKTGTSRIGLSWNCNNCDPNGANPIFLPAYNTPTSAVSPTGRIAFTHYASPWTGNPDYTLQKDDSGANVITSYSYDSYGRVTQKVMPKGNASRTIDANGNLQGSPDTTYATAYTYYAPTDTAAPPAACGGGSAVNQTGQLASKTPHGVASTSYVYDAAGNTIATTRAVGTICDTYTGENREATTTAPGDAQATTYAYDPTGALRTATDGSGTITREYDEAGDLKRTVDSFGGEEKFTFDAESNATSRVAAVGSLGSNPNYVTNYTYNDAGQLTQLTDPAGRVYKFFYDTRGNLKATQYPTPPLAGMTSTPTVGSWVSTTATARFQSHFRPRCRQTRSGARSPITPTPTALMARRVKKSGREAG